MARILVDSSRWPLLLVTLPHKVEDEDVRDYLTELQTFRERREPYAILVDSSICRGFSARQRRMQAEYIASGLTLSRVYLKALAFVGGSSLQRGMLTAIFWIKPPESPHKVFATVHDAEEWTRQFLPGIAAPLAREA